MCFVLQQKHELRRANQKVTPLTFINSPAQSRLIRTCKRAQKRNRRPSRPLIFASNDKKRPSRRNTPLARVSWKRSPCLAASTSLAERFSERLKAQTLQFAERCSSFSDERTPISFQGCSGRAQMNLGISGVRINLQES